MVKEAAEGKTKKLISLRKKKTGGIRNFLLEKTSFGRNMVFKTAKKRVLKQTGGNYPAHLKAIDAVRLGLKLPIAE